MGIILGFTDLKVWQKSHNFVLNIYRVTRDFPMEERFGLISQMRRAAVSVPANIAEGFRKKGKKDKANFFNIAQGSLDEAKYYIILSRDLGYLKEADPLLDDADEIQKMIFGFVKSLY